MPKKVLISGLFIVVDSDGKAQSLKGRIGETNNFSLFTKTVNVFVDGKYYNIPRKMLKKI